MNFNRFSKARDDRDRLMNRWRQSSSTQLSMMIRDIIVQLENYERYFGLRQRARRMDDQTVFVQCVEALVCDLVHRALTSENMRGRVAVSLDTSLKNTRYKSSCDTKQFPPIVKMMVSPEMGFLDIVTEGGWAIGKRTAIRAGARLLDMIDEWQIELTDLTLKGDEEIVIQKTDKHSDENTLEGRADWIDYKDNWLTNKYRKQIRTINKMIADTAIGYTGGRLVDLSDKKLRRVFNNSSFKQGGRLAGGFWHYLKGKQRKLITLNGESVHECDFSSMQVALAYAKAGVKFDLPRDAYDIDVIDTKPGEEIARWSENLLREGIKKIMASMMFARKPLKHWPRDTLHYFPPGTKLNTVRTAIERAHPALAKFWYKGSGFRLMHTESEILIEVMLRLHAEGVVSLPVHDCVVVPENRASLASKIMREVFNIKTGGMVGVTIDGVKLAVVA